jgi:hypothetical protein
MMGQSVFDTELLAGKNQISLQSFAMEFITSKFLKEINQELLK